MNVRRLQHLITVLEKVSQANLAFSLDKWMSSAGAVAVTAGDRANSCGTAACAVGYAALDPVFRAEGLQLRFPDMPNCPIKSIADYARRANSGTPEPVYDGFKSGWSAAIGFFELTDSQPGRVPVHAECI